MSLLAEKSLRQKIYDNFILQPLPLSDKGSSEKASFCIPSAVFQMTYLSRLYAMLVEHEPCQMQPVSASVLELLS